MYLAAERNYFDVAELLIRSGADVDSEDNVSTVFIPIYCCDASLTTPNYSTYERLYVPLFSILRDIYVFK